MQSHRYQLTQHFNVYCRHSEEVVRVFGSGGPPVKGTAEYYSNPAAYDQRRSRPTTRNSPACTFPGGDVTENIHHVGCFRYALPCVRTSCPYEVNYMSENTLMKGFLVKDLMHLEIYDKNKNATKIGTPVVVFGCGEVETGLLLSVGGPNGFLGLGHTSLDVRRPKGSFETHSLCVSHPMGMVGLLLETKVTQTKGLSDRTVHAYIRKRQLLNGLSYGIRSRKARSRMEIDRLTITIRNIQGKSKEVNTAASHASARTTLSTMKIGIL